jgi:hypothetical protein
MIGLHLPNSGGRDGARGPWSTTRTPRRAGDRSLSLTDCAKSVWGTLGTCTREPQEMRRFVCPVPVSKLINVGRQLVLIAASRCYLIQMLRSALACTNGCSCWSPDEENSPGFFLTMDALYRLS